MKYTYLETTVLIAGMNGNYATYKNDQEDFYSLFNDQKYKEVYIKVKQETDEVFYFSPNQLAYLTTIVNLTLREFFTQDFAPGFLTSIDPPPSKPIDYLKYADAEQYQHGIIFDDLSAPKVSNYVPLTDLPDLGLVKLRYGTNLGYLDTNSLVAVNGFLHETVVTEDDHELFIKDGGKTANVSGYKTVSLLTFDEGVKSIKKVPLSLVMINPAEGNNKLYGKVTITDIINDSTDSQVLLSLGGYLILPEPGVFYRDSSNSFALDLTKINFEKKIAESSRYLDLSGLGLLDRIPDTEQSDYSLLRSDAVLNAWFNLSQSFLIIVPKKNFLTYRNNIRRNGEFTLTFTLEPNVIITSSVGRIVSYHTFNYIDNYQQARSDMVIKDYKNNYGTPDTETYLRLIKAYPKLTVKEVDIVDELVSIGFKD